MPKAGGNGGISPLKTSLQIVEGVLSTVMILPQKLGGFLKTLITTGRGGAPYFLLEEVKAEE